MPTSGTMTSGRSFTMRPLRPSRRMRSRSRPSPGSPPTPIRRKRRKSRTSGKPIQLGARLGQRQNGRNGKKRNGEKRTRLKRKRRKSRKTRRTSMPVASRHVHQNAHDAGQVNDADHFLLAVLQKKKGMRVLKRCAIQGPPRGSICLSMRWFRNLRSPDSSRDQRDHRRTMHRRPERPTIQFTKLIHALDVGTLIVVGKLNDETCN
jgi:hypothetical protein